MTAVEANPEYARRSPAGYVKRLIEVDLPIKRISSHARREKSIRHGHVSTLHIWWARRPLAACRAVLCASLWPDPADQLCAPGFLQAARLEMEKWATANVSLLQGESLAYFLGVSKSPGRLREPYELRSALLNFISDFSDWDNSNNPEFLHTARLLTQVAHKSMYGDGSDAPLVLDPFAGGGSIPLEALRVGAETFASDINPVAVLLNRVLLNYIPKYGKRLADKTRRKAEWVKERVEASIGAFYPRDPDGAIPVAYLWARTITCEGPGCGAEVPLIRSLLLAQRGSKSVGLRLIALPEERKVSFEILPNALASQLGEGTVRRGSATCPCCGFTTPASNVRNQFQGRHGGANDARLIAVVTITGDRPGKTYRIAAEHDLTAFAEAKRALRTRLAEHSSPYSLVPDEELPYLRSIFNIQLLGVHRWADLFSDRQLLTLATFWGVLSELSSTSTVDAEFDRASTACVALAIDRLSAQYSSLAWWQPKGEFVVGTFGRQALGIIWDFAEIRPVAGASGDFDGAVDWVTRVIEGAIDSGCGRGEVLLASATASPLPDDSVSLLFTDPPYYDAVPYADLSDFFYTQLKRMVASEFPELFLEELTPKDGEIVQLAERNKKYAFKTKAYFEENMRRALAESRRVLSPVGLGVVVFAHKTTDGWEAMLSSLVAAGWTATASWPIDTERAVRMRAKDSAALGSSIHIVCRPRDRGGSESRVGDWRDVLEELPQRIHAWLPRLMSEGIVGADAIFACLGPALEVFSRYDAVEKASGEPVELTEYLEHVWAAVSREALSLLFRDADASGLEPDARLTAIWLWTLSSGLSATPESTDGEEGEDVAEDDGRVPPGPSVGFFLEYDAARKIAQGLGAHLDKLGNLLEVKGETARLLPVIERTSYLFGKGGTVDSIAKRSRTKVQLDMFSDLADVNSDAVRANPSIPSGGRTVLDRIHQAMILFGRGQAPALHRFLVEQGAGNDQFFWRVAQALSALYPRGTDEKRWVDGVLARKKTLGF